MAIKKKHICSYRIEHAVNIDIPRNYDKKKIVMIKNIISAVDIHCQAMKYVSAFFISCDTFTNIH